MRVGYARVSTKDQSPDLQIDALKKAKCDEIFTEVASGSKTARPVLDDLLSRLRSGDVPKVKYPPRLIMQAITYYNLALREHFATSGKVAKSCICRSEKHQMRNLAPKKQIKIHIFAHFEGQNSGQVLIPKAKSELAIGNYLIIGSK